jgi:hypothetical protein
VTAGVVYVIAVTWATLVVCCAAVLVVLAAIDRFVRWWPWAWRWSDFAAFVRAFFGRGHDGT